LEILADGDVGDAAGVIFREIGEYANLLATQKTVGDADADHEKFGGLAFAVRATQNAGAVALCVYAPGTEIGAEPFGWDGITAVARKFADFVEVVPRELFAFQAFDALGFRFFWRCCFWHLPLFLNSREFV
jgi:hypothetical protein